MISNDAEREEQPLEEATEEKAGYRIEIQSESYQEEQVQCIAPDFDHLAFFTRFKDNSHEAVLATRMIPMIMSMIPRSKPKLHPSIAPLMIPIRVPLSLARIRSITIWIIRLIAVTVNSQGGRWIGCMLCIMDERGNGLNPVGYQLVLNGVTVKWLGTFYGSSESTTFTTGQSVVAAPAPTTTPIPPTIQPTLPPLPLITPVGTPVPVMFEILFDGYPEEIGI